MRREKYIVERYSRKAGHEGELQALQVSIHYTESGERKSLKKTFPLKNYRTPTDAMNAAKAYRDANVSKIANATFEALPESITVNDVFELVPQYWPLSQATIEKDAKVYRKYIQPEFGEQKITKITKQDIRKTLAECAAHCVDQHVRNVKTVWHKIFSVAIEKDIVTKDLTQFVKAPRGEHITERSRSEQNITEEDFQKFCTAMQEYGHYLPNETEKIYNRDIMLMMIQLQRVTGIRGQEVRAIYSNSVRFECYQGPDGLLEEMAKLTISVSIGSTNTEKLTVKHTKTKKSVRVLPVYGTGVKILKKALCYTKHDLVFARYDGRPFSSDEYSDYLYRVSKSCGIKVYSVLMRKSFSSDLIGNGVDPESVKELMGHEDINMSLDYASSTGKRLAQTMMDRESLYKK